MKLKLPLILLGAVLAATAQATDRVTFDNSKKGHANVTIKKDAGNMSDYYMYGTYLTNPVGIGVVGGAASGWDHENNAPIEKFESATVTMKGGENLEYLCGYGLPGSAVEGDTTINMEDGHVKFIVGGYHYAAGANRDRDPYGIDPGYDHTKFGYKGQNQPSK